MATALNADAEMLELLIKAGAEENVANVFGATAPTKDEIAKLNAWIAQGANWPEGVALHTPGK